MEEKRAFKFTPNCDYCNVELNMLHIPVRDHCHLSGEFRVELCSKCNLNRQNHCYLPVKHGSSYYASHFIIIHLECDTEDIIAIQNSTE